MLDPLYLSIFRIISWYPKTSLESLELRKDPMIWSLKRIMTFVLIKGHREAKGKAGGKVKSSRKNKPLLGKTWWWFDWDGRPGAVEKWLNWGYILKVGCIERLEIRWERKKSRMTARILPKQRERWSCLQLKQASTFWREISFDMLNLRCL